MGEIAPPLGDPAWRSGQFKPADAAQGSKAVCGSGASASRGDDRRARSSTVGARLTGPSGTWVDPERDLRRPSRAEKVR